MRNLHSDAYTTDQAALKRLDDDVLRFLQRSQKRRSETFIRAGEIARQFSVDSVQALGSLERLKPRLRKLRMI